MFRSVSCTGAVFCLVAPVPIPADSLPVSAHASVALPPLARSLARSLCSLSLCLSVSLSLCLSVSPSLPLSPSLPIYPSIHPSIYIFLLDTSIYVYMYIYVWFYMYVNLYKHTYAYVYMHMHTHVPHIHMYAGIYIQAVPYMHIDIYK